MLLSLVREGNEVTAYLVNDLMEAIEGALTLRVIPSSGVVRDSVTPPVSVAVAANRVSPPASFSVTMDSQSVVLHASLASDDPRASTEAWMFLDEPRALMLQDAGLHIDVADTDHGPALTIEATHVAAYVRLSAPGLDPLPWSDNYFHLLPQHPQSVTVPGRPDLAAETLRAHLRVRTLNPGSSDP